MNTIDLILLINQFVCSKYRLLCKNIYQVKGGRYGDMLSLNGFHAGLVGQLEGSGARKVMGNLGNGVFSYAADDAISVG